MIVTKPISTRVATTLVVTGYAFIGEAKARFLPAAQMIGTRRATA